MSRPGPFSERAVILAPHGRDAQIAVGILKEAGFPAEVAADLAALLGELEKGAGLAIIADEATRGADLRPLATFLRHQPPWSDVPIILMTHHGGGVERNPAATRLVEALGNVTFLERPFHPTTLASVVGTAVRSRRRQYEARMHLEELREGEQQLVTALKAGELGSWSLDVRRMQLSSSEACRAHFGRGPEQPFTYGDFLGASVHADDVERMRAALEHTLRTGEDCAVEYRNVWPDGSIHWVDVRARAIREASGQVKELVGVSSDITRRKHSELERERLLGELAAERAALSDLTHTLEQRVQERTAELVAEVAARQRAQEQLLQSQKMESLGQLTGGVAHDFNNLLTAVLSNLELLRKRMPGDPRLYRLVDGAIQGAQRGASLTQRMLAFARQQDLKTDSADMVALLIGMRDMLRRTLGPRIDLVLHTENGVPPAQVDANQIELAILNLTINARDAMPDGGRIEIDVAQAQPGADKGLSDGSYLRIRIADTGSGMDDETLKRAIEPFFSTKPLGKGTGLGLSMVHGLAVQLGGLLELCSAPGKGTTATLWLPATTSEPAAELPAAVPAASGRAATVLVVDDDALILMSTVEMVEDLGHTVLKAHSARGALDILGSGHAVDIVVTDYAMPGMTGGELAQIVNDKWPGLPILLTTGYSEPAVGQKADLPRLTKPFGQSQLQREINRLLASAGNAAHSADSAPAARRSG